jgi:hypothetical protein
MYNAAIISSSELFISNLGEQGLLPCFGFLVVHKQVFGGLIDPNSGIGVLPFGWTSIGKSHAAWYTCFHCID